MTTIGVGIIGAGKHGQRYLAHAGRDVPGLRVAALARRDHAAGREQARATGCRYHDAWPALVDDPDVSAVVAVVPPTMHAAIVRRVAERGKALVIEKPLATTGAEARALVDLVRATAIPVVMAQTLRWNAVVDLARTLLPTLGELRALGITQRFEPSRLPWLDQPHVSGGGIILHTGVHSFDLVRHVTGRDIERVQCWTRATRTTRTEDNFAALCTLAGSEALVTVTGSRDSRGRCGLIDAAGTDGHLIADHQQHWGHSTRGLERVALDLPPPVHTVRAVLESLLALLTLAHPPPAAVEDGARAVLVAEACLRSAATGRPAEVEPL